jgi:type I restriction enzyme S subunit
MARAKKETALTPEERLQAALVPDWEWPYKLPGNWCWTYLTKAAECLDNFRKPINATERAGRNGNVPYYGATGQVGWIDDFLTDEDLVLLGEDGAPFLDLIKDKAYLITGKAWVNNHAHILRSLFGDTGNRYLLHYLNSFNYAGYVNGTTRLKLTRASMDTIPIPIPPLAEQQRIVDRIESLFAKLDEAKEKAQAVVDSFETRKAAILHKAFTGELTAKWREEHGVGMESWEVRTLDSVCSSIFDGDHMPPPKAESGIPFLVISNVNTGHLTFENTRFVPQEYYDTLSDTRKPQLGDVLYTLVGSFGIPVVVNSKRPFCFQRHMALLRPIDVSPQFLWYILQTPEMYDKASSIATGTAQLTVPIKGLRAMTIPRPNIAEQVEIVRILDGFFAREQSAKEAAEAVLDQIDLMKKSILARAFRGELGTNDPSEESAAELLKRGLEKK